MIQLICHECGKDIREVGTLIRGECWYCRFPFLICKERCIKSREERIKLSGRPLVLKVFIEFVENYRLQCSKNNNGEKICQEV